MADTFITEAYLKEKKREVYEKKQEPLKTVKFNRRPTDQSQQISIQPESLEEKKRKTMEKTP